MPHLFSTIVNFYQELRALSSCYVCYSCIITRGLRSSPMSQKQLGVAYLHVKYLNSKRMRYARKKSIGSSSQGWKIIDELVSSG